MTQNNDPRDYSFSKFADAYVELFRMGKAPSIEQAIEEFPHLEPQIRRHLPSLLLLEETLGKSEFDPIAEQPIPGCELTEEIGRGSSGVVYRGHQGDLNREVAVKSIRVPSGDEKVLKRFGVECKAMAKLEHPNIVPVHGFMQASSHAFLIMKLIDGFSFDRLLGGNCSYRGTVLLHTLRNDCAEFAFLARDISSALAHAHASGMVHRDIKPSNLILDQNGKVWISDFGLVKAQDSATSLSRTGDVVGTPRYMAPEQLRGVCDARSDIYSLGLTLYEIATGRHARSSGRAIDDSNGGCIELGKQVGELPAELVQVIDKASAFSPEDRFQSAQELTAVLDRFLSGLKPDRRKSRRKPDHIYRRRWRLKVAGVAALALGAGGLSIYSPIAGPKDPLALANPPFTDELTLLERLAEDPKNGLPEFVKEVALNQVGHASDHMNLSDNERSELIADVEYLIDDIQTETVEKVLDRYHKSPLSMATRVMAYDRIVIGSARLDANTKRKGHDTLRRLAYAVSSGEITQQETQRMLDALTVGRRVALKELPKIELSDNQVANWLRFVSGSIASVRVSEAAIEAELVKIFKDLDSKVDSSEDAPESETKAFSDATRRTIENEIDSLPQDQQEWVRKRLRAKGM